ncbi:hypothetical protein GE09DRAFT_350107 [Coniochaeta sp. 2T2.1]|nr:hypothetical protein GE09DRAFT_350107 [Coniochaeta sp. 2T2.1]
MFFLTEKAPVRSAHLGCTVSHEPEATDSSDEVDVKELERLLALVLVLISVARPAMALSGQPCRYICTTRRWQLRQKVCSCFMPMSYRCWQRPCPGRLSSMMHGSSSRVMSWPHRPFLMERWPHIEMCLRYFVKGTEAVSWVAVFGLNSWTSMRKACCCAVRQALFCFLTVDRVRV